MLGNTLTVEYLYFCSNRENTATNTAFKCSYLKKPETFCCNFIVFFESKSNFEHFVTQKTRTKKKKKKGSRSLSISELIDSERRRYLNAYSYFLDLQARLTIFQAKTKSKILVSCVFFNLLFSAFWKKKKEIKHKKL